MIIFESAIAGKIKSVLLWSEIVVFFTGYAIIFLEKIREKRIIKHNNDIQHVKYIKAQKEDEQHKISKDLGRATNILDGYFYQNFQINKDKPKMHENSD